jgi:hypothetical protein
MKSKAKPKVFSFLITGIIITLCSFMFEFWLENGSEEIYNTVNNFCPAGFRLLIFAVVLISIFVVIYRMTLYFYDTEIERLNDILKDESKQIWKKYHELQKYKKHEILKSILANFIDESPFVIGVQLCKYTVNIDSNKTKIKITHEYGHVSEDSSLNALLQSYYQIDTKIYIDFMHAIKIFGND